MARKGSASDRPTAWTRMPSGKTLSQEIRDRGGVTGQARVQRGGVFSRNRAGEVPFTLEDLIPEEHLQKIKYGDLDNDHVPLDRYGNNSTVNPFAAMPHAPTKQQLRDIVTLYDDAGSYYEPEVGEGYRNFAARPVLPGSERANGLSDGTTSAAPLSEVPTSTTNPARPRTVAAGYLIEQGASTGKVTVVFRDGTYYNYYEVKPDTWASFRGTQSKGVFIRDVLDKHPRGVANSSNIDPQMRSQLYMILETAQRYSRGKLAAARTRRQRTQASSPSRANPKPKQRR